MASAARRVAEGGEGADPPRRRARAEAARAAVGPGRGRLPVRDGARHEDARRAVRRPLAAARLPLHVRPALRLGLPGLLVDRRHARRAGRPPEGEGHDAAARLPRAARAAARVQGPDGLGHRLGLERRQRLQPRPRLHEHGGGAEAVPRRRDPVDGRAERALVRNGREGYVTEGPGLSVYALSDGRVYRTYVTSARGLEVSMAFYGFSIGRRTVATRARRSRSGSAATTNTRPRSRTPEPAPPVARSAASTAPPQPGRRGQRGVRGCLRAPIARRLRCS